MPAQLEFDLWLRPGDATTPTPRAPGPVRRLLLLGNFSGQAAAGRAPLAQRRTQGVDFDSLEQAMTRLAPGLTLKLGDDSARLTFGSLDDFHADALLQASQELRRLSDLRTQLSHPASFAQAAAQLMGAGTAMGAGAGAGAGGTPDLTLAAWLGRSPAAAASPLAPSQAPSATAVAAPSATTPDTSPSASMDAFIRQLVAPCAQPSAPPQQAAYVAATQAVLTQSLRSHLHHPEFQALEANWLGVSWLLSTLELDETLELHLLDVTRDELHSDVLAAQGQVDAMQLAQVLGLGAGTPARWTALLGLLAFEPTQQDLTLLAALGHLARAVGAPLVAGAGPGLMAAQLTAAAPAAGPALDLNPWQALRRSDVAPWLGLAAPRLLMRVPYGRGGQQLTAFAFEETDSASGHDCFLWGPAALACAGALLQPQGPCTIDGLPGWSVQREGEPEQLPCAEHWLSESAWQALLQAGLMPLVSHTGRHAVQLPRLQSLAQPPQPLAGF